MSRWQRVALGQMVMGVMGVMGCALGLASEVEKALPEKAPGFEPAGQPERFVGKKALFDYMDGGAEVYLAYGFVDIGVRNYLSGAEKATLEIYQLGSPDDAFGAFSLNSRGENLDLGGTPSSLGSGMLSFFKGRFYVRVVAKTEPAKARELMIALGKKVAATLPGESRVPAAVDSLPPGATQGTLRYFTGPDTAKTLWFDGEGQALLTPGARAFSASYPGGSAEVQITRVAYPGKDGAVKACQELAKKLALKPEAGPAGCAAAGKAADEAFALIAVKDCTLRWVHGAVDLTAAKAWADKIK